MKKDATIRARIPKRVADMIATESKNQGVMNLSDYVRVAVLEKLSRDTKQPISELLEK